MTETAGDFATSITDGFAEFRALFDLEQSMGQLTPRERALRDAAIAHGRAEGRKAAPQLLPPEPKTPARVRIPKLELQTLPRYIAAVSKGLERGELKAQDARAMLYGAQMLLAAWNALGAALPDDDAKTRIGFIQAAAESLKVSIHRTKL